MEKENKSFYLNDNVSFILDKGFQLVQIDEDHDDFGTFKSWVFQMGKAFLRVPYRKLCYNDLVHNEYFLKRLAYTQEVSSSEL